MRKIVIMACVAVMSACGSHVTAPEEDDRLRVVATTTIVGDLVRTIGGSEVQLEVLMGPGVDPHLYKASAGDVRRMSSAKAIFFNGLHLEGKMTEVLERMGERGVTTVAVGECLPAEDLITSAGFSGLHDPHVWFDVGLWAQATSCVADALAELVPAHADAFRNRAQTYHDELMAFDGWVHGRVGDLEPEQRVLVTAHDAFSYFGRTYDFEVYGLLGVSTASEAGTSDVKELAHFIVERRVPAIFVETSVPPRYVQALKEAVEAQGFAVEIGGTLYSDSLGDSSHLAHCDVENEHANVETIVTALAGKR